MTTDLVTWLRQQLDEDDTVIARNRGRAGLGDDGSYPDYQTYDGEDIDAAGDYLRRFAPPRMAAEVDAKRRILDRVEFVRSHGPARDSVRAMDMTTGALAALMDVVKFLALPYADRPGYDERWRT